MTYAVVWAIAVGIAFLLITQEGRDIVAVILRPRCAHNGWRAAVEDVHTVTALPVYPARPRCIAAYVAGGRWAQRLGRVKQS